MKQSSWTFAALLALGLLIEAPALAQTPPKKMCLQWGAGPTVSILTVKPRGSINMSGGPVTFYSVVSETSDGTDSFPMIGSGHVSGNGFHFQATGGTSVGGPVVVSTMEVGYDLVAQSGVGLISLYNAAFPGVTSPFTTLLPVDCRTVTIPYGKEGGGLSSLEDLLGLGEAQ